jgi:hypothetical protein
MQGRVFPRHILYLSVPSNDLNFQHRILLSSLVFRSSCDSTVTRQVPLVEHELLILPEHQIQILHLFNNQVSWHKQQLCPIQFLVDSYCPIFSFLCIVS